MKLRITLGLFLCVALASGCASIMRSEFKDDSTQFYPATQADGALIHDAFAGKPVFGMNSEGGCEPLNRVVWSTVQATFGIVDLIISLVADTILFPYDLATSE